MDFGTVVISLTSAFVGGLLSAFFKFRLLRVREKASEVDNEVKASAASIENVSRSLTLMQRSHEIERDMLRNLIKENTQIIENNRKAYEEMLEKERCECDEKIAKIGYRLSELEARREYEHSLPFCYWVMVDGYYKYVNQTAWVKIFSKLGYTQKGVIEKSDYEIWPETIANHLNQLDMEARNNDSSFATGIVNFPGVGTYRLYKFVIPLEHSEHKVAYAGLAIKQEDHENN